MLCICVDFEKQMVLRTKRLMRVRSVQYINLCIPKNDLEPTDERGKVGKRSLAVSALQGIPFDCTQIVGHPIHTLFQSLYTHLGMTLSLDLLSDLRLHLFQSHFGAVLRLDQGLDQLW